MSTIPLVPQISPPAGHAVRVARLPFAGLLLGAALAAQSTGLSVVHYGTPSGNPALVVDQLRIGVREEPTRTVIQITGGRPGQLGAIVIGFARASLPVMGATLRVDPNGCFVLAAVLDGNGSADFSLPVLTDLGLTFMVQALNLDAASPDQLFVFSWGLEVKVAPRVGTSTAFDMPTAKALLELTWDAYEYDNSTLCNGTLKLPPRGGGRLFVGRRLVNGFQVVATITTTNGNNRLVPQTFAFLAVNPACDVAVVFRGTDLCSIRDWLTDISAVQDPTGFHAGFLQAFRAVDGRLRLELAKVVNTNTRVYIAGHSLGGALAAVAAHELQPDLASAGIAQNDVIAYTFASPRAMSPARASTFNSRVPHHYAVANKDDVVTHLPPRAVGPATYSHIRRMRVLYPTRTLLSENGDDYAIDPGLQPPPVPIPQHIQYEYLDRLTQVLPAPRVHLSVSTTVPYGYMTIHWNYPERQGHGYFTDSVALYDVDPAAAGPNLPIPVGQWYAAGAGGSFITTRPKGPDFHIAYIQQFGPVGERKFLATAGPYTWDAPTVRLTQNTILVQMNWQIADPGAFDDVALYDGPPSLSRIPLVVRNAPGSARSWLTSQLWNTFNTRFYIAYIERATATAAGRIAATWGPHR